MIRLILIASVLIFAAGCANLDKPYPERAYYQFEVSYQGQKNTPVPGTILDVNRIEVSPGSEGLEFIYRVGEFKFHSDFYNQFFRPPGSLITDVTTSWFSSSGLFQEVLGQLSQAFANYFIEGNVVKLYADYRSGAAPKAVMEIQFFLLKNTGDEDSPIIVTSGTYTVEKPISGKDPKSLMAGWNQALIDILQDSQKDVKENLWKSMQKPPPPPPPHK